VTAHYVSGHRDRVRTLTLVDPVATSGGLPLLLRLPLIGDWIWQTLHVPEMAEGQLSDFLHPERHPTWVAQYRPQMRYRGFGHALLETLKAESHVSIDSLYSGVARSGVPVLLVWGRQDQTVPFALSDVVRRNIPSADFLPVDSAGHLPHIEQASLVNAKLAAFLAAHGT
ncbi:MAG TPA: alpha/beta fold hydrolase, partial [Gemmatimonadales bacterium]|nr:alpha/beta fold hydrolase [Gemmatimonadales bacterium]